MSDTLVLGLFIPLITAISAWVTIWLNGRVAAKLAAQLAENNKKLVVVENKLDESHRQMNGNLDKLIKSTSDLATLTEKNKHTDK